MGLFVFTSRSARLSILTLLTSKTLKLSIQKYIGSKQVVFPAVFLIFVLVSCVDYMYYSWQIQIQSNENRRKLIHHHLHHYHHHCNSSSSGRNPSWQEYRFTGLNSFWWLGSWLSSWLWLRSWLRHQGWVHAVCSDGPGLQWVSTEAWRRQSGMFSFLSDSFYFSF